MVHREWAQSLFRSLTMPLQIILDGADQLLPDASSFRFLQTLLDQAPSNVRFIILSQEQPPLDLSKLKMRREVMVLDNGALAFSLAEARDFFGKIPNISLTSEQVEKFHRTTEGWIGGLILLAESLHRLPRTMTVEAIFKALSDHFERELFDYFAKAIFATLPIDLRDFLIHSSVLNPVEPFMVSELTGREKAFETLETLARRNLFVQSFYEREKGWGFRFHQLFREFLQAKVRDEMTDEARRTLFLRAASLYEQNARLEDAIKLYLAGKAYPHAVSVLQPVGVKLLRQGRLVELSGWIDSIPADLIADNSRLLFYRYMSRRFTHFQENLPDLVRAYQLCREEEDVRGLLLCLASLIEAMVTRGSDIIPPIHQLLPEAEKLVLSQSSAEYPYERALLYLQMGLGYFLKTGNPRNGAWACLKAHLLAKDIKDFMLQTWALINLHLCQSTLGEFKNAREVMQRVEALLAQCSSSELRGLHLIHCAHACWLEHDMEKMHSCLQEVRKVIETSGCHYLYPIYMRYQVSYLRQAGRLTEAIEAGETLLQLTSTAGNMWLHGNALLQTGLAYYFQGQTHKAQELYQQAQDILSKPESYSDFHRNCTSVALALTAYHLHTDGDAEKKLALTIGDWREKGINLFLKEAYLAMSLLQWQHGERQKAAENLKAGFKLMREFGFHANLLLNRADLVGTLVLALELELEMLSDYVFHRLTTDLADIAEAELERLHKHKNPRVADKVSKIRTAIHRRHTPSLRIETLGRFQVLRGETLVAETDWGGNQPKLMLKALLARGRQNVAKDVLIEDLWPEISTTAGDRNFRVILHRLRKALEPSMDKEFGSAYVHLKANRVSLDQELCSVDVEQFAALCDQAREMERAGDLRKALATCEEATKLYGGDFLVEEKYQPWAGLRRDELHRQHMALLFRLAGLYEQQGKTKKAISAYSRILTADPLEEQACRRLMTLYADRGMRSEALRAYEICRRALEQELGTTPDELTVSMYKLIAEGSRQQKSPEIR